MTDSGSHHQPVPDRAGWFDDPDDSEQLRYFDGILWTDHTTPRRTIWRKPEPTQPLAETTATGEQPAPLPSLYAPHQDAGISRSQRHTNPYGAQPVGYQQPMAAPSTSDGSPLASMSARFGAWLIDSCLTWALGLVLGGYLLWRGLGNYPEIIGEALREQLPATDAAALAERVQFDLTWLGMFAVLQLVIGVGYHSYFLSRTGATIGKRAAGISVRLAERPGVLTPADAMRRSLLRPVLFLFVSTPGLGLLAAPLSVFEAAAGTWHPMRQTLHDRIGRTVVVRGPQPPREP